MQAAVIGTRVVDLPVGTVVVIGHVDAVLAVDDHIRVQGVRVY